MMAIFIFSIFISSFLLFQVQPLISKYILPWFGGATSVWSTSLLFFQVFLTGGYAYSFWLLKRLNPQRQKNVHLSLLGLSFILILANFFNWGSPILLNITIGTIQNGNPIGAILRILLMGVGLPYFFLATNSTLMQAWFVRIYPARSPYWLYAVSNLGSLIGLVSYPFLIEPWLPLKTQSIFWGIGFVIFFVLVSYQTLRISPRDPANDSVRLESVKNGKKQTLKQVLSWVGLAALASVLLLATTSQITQEIAVIPFLWVLPFTIYLISFILTFSDQRLYNRWVYLSILLFATAAYLWFVVSSLTGIVSQISIYLLILFACTMICHGELYRLRPAADDLSVFYLWVSVGGAFGGIIINLVVPNLLDAYWEFQITLGIVWFLMLFYTLKLPYQVNYYLRRGLTGVVAIMTLIVLASLYIQTNTSHQNSLAASRNFYGVLNIREEFPGDSKSHRNILTHGITTHGYQYSHPAIRNLPTAYYVEEAGVGIGFRYHPSRPEKLKVGMVGLGVGVLAAYGNQGDIFRFYELNPAVVEIAQSQYFTFLKDSKATIEIVLGDGRVSLEDEWNRNGSNQFDLLVLDAFNSDSIPTHLLTYEALALYLKHIKSDGILAFHISNNYLDLRPVIWQLADAYKMDGFEFYDTAENNGRAKPSLWIVLTKNQGFLNNPEVQALSREPEKFTAQNRLWTDDYSNLFQILK